MKKLTFWNALFNYDEANLEIKSLKIDNELKTKTIEELRKLIPEKKKK